MQGQSAKETMESARAEITIPSKFSYLFWDVNFSTIDLERHAFYVIERFLEYGTWEGIRWLRDRYGDERIKKYLLGRGYRVLSKKTLNFWKYILHLEEEQCLQPSSLSDSRKFWNY